MIATVTISLTGLLLVVLLVVLVLLLARRL